MKKFSQWLEARDFSLAVAPNSKVQVLPTPETLSPLDVSPKTNQNAVEDMTKAINIIIHDHSYKHDDPETAEFDPKSFAERYTVATSDGNEIRVHYSKTFGRGKLGKAVWSATDTAVSPFSHIAQKSGLRPDPEFVYRDILSMMLTIAERKGIIEKGTFKKHEWDFNSERFGRDIIIKPA